MAGMVDNLFDGVGNKAERLEEFTKSMDAAVAGKGPHKQFIMKDRGTVGSVGTDPRAEGLRIAAEKLAEVQKGLDPAQAANVQAALDEMSKDLSFGSQGISTPVPGNLAPYDLEAPAKILVPRFTPLRNEIPRVPGQGANREFRRILGYSNAQMAGVPDLGIFLDSETVGTQFGGVTGLRRGPKIQYQMDIQKASYVEMSVSDSVTYKAQFGNLGFENTRSLSAMALLWSHMIGEEKALLMGRGQTAMGYSGPFSASAPAAPTVTNSTASGTIPAASYVVSLGIQAGVGVVGGGTAATASVLTSSGSLTVTPAAALPAGALGYTVYAVAGGACYFLGLITGAAATTPSAVTFSSLGANIGSAAPTGNTTAGLSGTSGGYDGLLTVLTGPNSGYYASTGSNFTIATSGDAAFQDAFGGLYAKVFADPDEVWLNAVQSRHLGDFFRSANTSSGAGAFRINFQQTGLGQVGTVVESIYNQSSPTRKQVDLRVHPYMPAGAAIIRSRTLDIPDSGVGDTSQVVAVQEYMGIDWPQIQFTYDASTYWFGTFVHYAPAWSGAITGLS